MGTGDLPGHRYIDDLIVFNNKNNQINKLAEIAGAMHEAYHAYSIGVPGDCINYLLKYHS